MDSNAMMKKIEELQNTVAYQKRCIELYERDEFETSDRMESVVLKCYALMEEIEFYKALVSRIDASDGMSAYLFKEMQQERDDAIKRYQTAEEKLARIHEKEAAIMEVLDELDRMTYLNKHFKNIYEEAKSRTRYANTDYIFRNDALMEDA